MLLWVVKLELKRLWLGWKCVKSRNFGASFLFTYVKSQMQQNCGVGGSCASCVEFRSELIKGAQTRKSPRSSMLGVGCEAKGITHKTNNHHLKHPPSLAGWSSLQRLVSIKSKWELSRQTFNGKLSM